MYDPSWSMTDDDIARLDGERFMREEAELARKEAAGTGDDLEPEWDSQDSNAYHDRVEAGLSPDPADSVDDRGDVSYARYAEWQAAQRAEDAEMARIQVAEYEADREAGR